MTVTPDTASRVVAVVPVRGLPAGKVRLAALLNVDQRNRLVRAMLADVVLALRDAPEIGGVVILSRDAAAARVAARMGVEFQHQPPAARGLNAGLRAAQQVHRHESALLIVPADIPLITPQDIAAVLGRLPPDDAPAVLVVPADDGGTNGLLIRPPAAIAPRFGPDSAERHCAAAGSIGIEAQLYAAARWALDVDTPEDLLRLPAAAVAHHRAQRLETLRCLQTPDFRALLPD